MFDRASALLLLSTLALAACDEAAARRPAAGPAVVRTAMVMGLTGPESARYDAEQDVFFVSNMQGYGSDKDGRGYIVRVPAGATHEASIFVESGMDGVRLDAPKGMTIHGDTLWVCDIDILRGFDRHTGKLLAEVDFTPKHAIQLNDVDVGPDGRLYVTDTGIDMTDKGVIYVGGDRIYAVGAGGAIATIDSGPQLGRPNGITWDAKRQRWLVTDFEPFSSKLYAMRQGDTARTVLAHGKGKWDGVEALPDGRILYASWSDSSVHVLSPDGTDTQLVTSAPTPADIGIDTRRMRVAIPVTNLNRLEIWTIPRAARATRARD